MGKKQSKLRRVVPVTRRDSSSSHDGLTLSPEERIQSAEIDSESILGLGYSRLAEIDAPETLFNSIEVIKRSFRPLKYPIETFLAQGIRTQIQSAAYGFHSWDQVERAKCATFVLRQMTLAERHQLKLPLDEFDELFKIQAHIQLNIFHKRFGDSYCTSLHIGKMMMTYVSIAGNRDPSSIVANRLSELFCDMTGCIDRKERSRVSDLIDMFPGVVITMSILLYGATDGGQVTVEMQTTGELTLEFLHFFSTAYRRYKTLKPYAVIRKDYSPYEEFNDRVPVKVGMYFERLQRLTHLVMSSFNRLSFQLAQVSRIFHCLSQHFGSQTETVFFSPQEGEDEVPLNILNATIGSLELTIKNTKQTLQFIESIEAAEMHFRKIYSTLNKQVLACQSAIENRAGKVVSLFPLNLTIQMARNSKRCDKICFTEQQKSLIHHGGHLFFPCSDGVVIRPRYVTQKLRRNKNLRGCELVESNNGGLMPVAVDSPLLSRSRVFFQLGGNHHENVTLDLYAAMLW